MCDAIVLATTALSVAQSGAGIVGQRAAAKSQFRANARQREAQNEEIRAQASVRSGERVKQARAERARLRVAGGEANIGGNSFQALLQDSIFQEDQDIATIGLDARFQDRASEARFLSANAAVRNPSLLENGLTLANAGARGFNLGQSITSRVPSSSLEIPTSEPFAGGTELTGATRGLA